MCWAAAIYGCRDIDVPVLVDQPLAEVDCQGSPARRHVGAARRAVLVPAGDHMRGRYRGPALAFRKNAEPFFMRVTPLALIT
jgi:hypothetical protein